MKRRILLLAMLGLAAACCQWHLATADQVWHMLQSGDIGALAVYLESFGAQSILVTLLLFVVMTFTFIFPFFILAGAAGAVFGIYWGILISWGGEVCGALLMFALARYFFRGYVEEWMRQKKYGKHIERYSRESGFRTLLAARLVPVIPSGILSALTALSGISFHDYFWATLLGKLPPVAVKVIIGHDLVFMQENETRLWCVAGAAISVYLFCWLYRKLRKRE